MLRGISRLIVATAAGAGLGAGAGLLRRRAMHAHEHPDGPAEFAGPPSEGPGTDSAFAPEAPVTVVRPGPEPPSPEPVASGPEASPAPVTTPAPDPGPDAAVPTASEIDALTAQVADLEEARNRLRRRAAMLRAEMEGPPES